MEFYYFLLSTNYDSTKSSLFCKTIDIEITLACNNYSTGCSIPAYDNV